MSARAARHVADRVQHLAQINRGLATPPRRLRQQRLDPNLCLVREARLVALRRLAKLGHSALGVSGPHPGLEAPPPRRSKPFSNGHAAVSTAGAVHIPYRNGHRSSVDLNTHGAHDVAPPGHLAGDIGLHRREIAADRLEP
jgi:hypothetical protein